MVKLIARPAFEAEGETIGDVTLRAVTEGAVTSIAPFRGQEGAVSAALMQAFGLGFPAVGKDISAKGTRLLWAGRGRALLIGPEAPDLAGLAAVTTQTGAEAVMQLEGEGVEAVLARLVPMDLRLARFGTGSTARTQVAHMTASVTRMEPSCMELRVMRSMAETLWHDVTEAAGLFAARGVT